MSEGLLIFCIANPTSGCGRGGKLIDPLSAQLSKHFGECQDHVEDGVSLSMNINESKNTVIFAKTKSHGDGMRLGRAACAMCNTNCHRDCVVLIVGGDGTLSEVINGLTEASFAAKIYPKKELPARIVYLAAGTGADFARLGYCCSTVEEAVQAIKEPHNASVSVARMSYHNGAPTRYFVNVSSVGLASRVIVRAEELKRNMLVAWLGGAFVFILASAIEVILAQRQKIKLRSLQPEGDGVWHTYEATNIAFCNGQYCGGGMHMSPDADPTDRFLDVTIWTGGFFTFLFGLLSMYNGKHTKWESTTTLSGSTFEVCNADENLTTVEIDGELGNQLPATISVATSATFCTAALATSIKA